MIAVDTNVFVYRLDSDEPVKQAKARELLNRLTQTAEPAVLLWQTAVELLRNLRKRESKGQITSTQVEEHFHDLVAMFPLVLPDARLIPRYFKLFGRFSLSHWDAMLLAACKEAGVTTLYSEDMDAGTDYDGLAVVNPFA